MSGLVFRSVRGRILTRVDRTFEPGLHAILADVPDGGIEFLEMAGGLVLPRRGRVEFDGKAPYASAELRRRIGVLLDREEVLESQTVAGGVQRVLGLRHGARDPASVLGEFGLAGWASRRSSSLSPREARALSLALALTVDSASLLALFEPLGTDLARDRVLRSLGEHAARGAVVLCVTSSVSDLTVLSGHVDVLDKGRFAGDLAVPPSTRRTPLESVVQVDRPREFVAALAAAPAVDAARWDEEAARGEVVVHGTDPDAVALAVLTAARDSGASIVSIVQRARHRTVPRGGGPS